MAKKFKLLQATPDDIMRIGPYSYRITGYTTRANAELADCGITAFNQHVERTGEKFVSPEEEQAAYQRWLSQPNSFAILAPMAAPIVLKPIGDSPAITYLLDNADLSDPDTMEQYQEIYKRIADFFTNAGNASIAPASISDISSETQQAQAPAGSRRGKNQSQSAPMST